VGVGHGDVTGGRRHAVFLDRDGVIVEPRPDPATGRAESPYRPEDVTLIPRAAAALRELEASGVVLVVVSNQPAAAKGTHTLGDLRAVHERTVELLAGEGVVVEDWRYCLHHPQGVVPELTRSCPCRKPAPGLILAAAEALDLDPVASWMVGDSCVDVDAGRRAGCRVMLVEHKSTAHRRVDCPMASPRTSDLWDAARVILHGG
jgi:D-glycero-D-manno-heptose 1,7-bisphosphate phosphatase